MRILPKKLLLPLLFLTPLLLVFIVQTTEAQKGIVFEVTTDKSQYAVGENISITIKAINTSSIPQTLSFSSSKQADYVIDGKYRQSANKFFAQSLTSVEVPGNFSYQWKFIHKSADYKLEAGSHTILGEVVGYGSASVQVTVETAAPSLIITTTSFPPATTGTPYETTVSASGGSGSYSWSADNFPPGLSLVSAVCIAAPCQAPATISGTPTTAGNYAFTIVVSDGTSKASRQFTINVSSVVRYFQYVMSSAPDESFLVKMTNPATIQQALDDLQGRRRLIVSSIVNSGDGGFNSPWSWHLDPARVILGEIFIEVCDGRPSYVETHLAEWLGQRYCPWGAKVNAVYEAPPTSTVPIQPKSTAPVTSASIQVQVDALNVRGDATLSAPKIELVRKGEVLKKLEEKNGWVKVELSSGQTGWVFGQYVAPATVPTVSAPRQKVIVTAWVLNVRSGAEINTRVITTVQRNAVLEKVEEKSGWIRIILPNGQSGWVYGKFVK